MMKDDDLENELRNLRHIHLTETEMVAYWDQELDQMRRTRVEAHAKECFICKRQLALSQEEHAALSNRGNVAIVEQQKGTAQSPSATKPAETAKWIPLQERLAEYLRQMVASWQVYFKQMAVRGVGNEGEEAWHWQSVDGMLQAHTILEENADLTIYISSNEPVLAGTPINVRLGPFSQKATLQPVSESEVGAKVTIPRWQRPRDMADITIESV
jgi:hypothetical protein